MQGLSSCTRLDISSDGFLMLWQRPSQKGEYHHFLRIIRIDRVEPTNERFHITSPFEEIERDEKENLNGYWEREGKNLFSLH